MKKYVFSIRKAVKNEVEIEAKNRAEAFKKLIGIFQKNDKKLFKNTKEAEVLRMKLERVFDTNDENYTEKTTFTSEEVEELMNELDKENIDISPVEITEI